MIIFTWKEQRSSNELTGPRFDFIRDHARAVIRVSGTVRAYSAHICREGEYKAEGPTVAYEGRLLSEEVLATTERDRIETEQLAEFEQAVEYFRRTRGE